MLTMFDDIRLDLIPANAQAVAGYVNGRWPTYSALVKQFPHAHKLAIAVNASADAECLDVEPGDATNAQAPPWVRRQLIRGVRRPVLYTSVSNAPALLATLASAGIPRTAIRIWTAHYTGKAHLCNPSCGFGMKTTADATQFDDHALGKSLDVSLCSDSFFPVAKPAVNPKKRIWAAHLQRTNRLLVALQTKAARLKHLLKRR